MQSFHEQVFGELRAGRDVCLAYIVRADGSAPRGQGTSFLVRADGSIIGTIGGGMLEARVIEEAAQALAQRESRLLRFNLTGEQVAASLMICGGRVEVYLEPLSAADSAALDLWRAAAELLARGRRGLMVTPVLPGALPTAAGRKLLLAEDAPTAGGLEALPELGGQLASQLGPLLDAGRSQLLHHAPLLGPGFDLFLEPVVEAPTVYIFGGGHVSLALANMVKMVGFRLVVMDDRPEFANRERFPLADDLWVRGYADALDSVELARQAYVVIVTRGHLHDKVVLAQALARRPVYLGMIGSRRKRDMIYQALLDDGFTADDLARVHSPIGLTIGAQTPEEIAVSIVAELIAVRAGRR